MESEERRNRSSDGNGGEAAATSLLAKIGSILCVTSTRCRERLCLYNLLDGRGIAGGLRLRRTAVLVSGWDGCATLHGGLGAKENGMIDRDNLHVEVSGGEIVITLPGTSYRAVYHKPADKPGLIATSRSGRWEQGTPMTQAEFNARAWQAANDKARELGWFV